MYEQTGNRPLRALWCFASFMSSALHEVQQSKNHEPTHDHIKYLTSRSGCITLREFFTIRTHPFPCTRIYTYQTKIQQAHQEQQGQHQNCRIDPKPRQPVLRAKVSSPSADTGGGGDATIKVTAHGDDVGGRGFSYRLPEYRHDAPWPRPRPSAEAAAKARVLRRARAERGASTAADARAEMEDKVCVLVFFSNCASAA